METHLHTQVGLANPYLICGECKDKVRYWHNPERCNCDVSFFNYPCEHTADLISTCPTWGPIYGCSCENKCNK
jgi:hypothetical protein